MMSNSVSLNFTATRKVQHIFKVNTIDANTITLGIYKVTSNRTITVYPSPAKDFVRLKVYNATGDYSLSILDATGREVLNQYPVMNNEMINLRSLGAGFYFLQAEGKGWKTNSKMVIQH